MKNFFLWVVFAPALLFSKDIKHWYVRLLLVLVSPFSLYALLSLFYLCYVTMVPVCDSYTDNHAFKNAEDIAKVTHSYIPPCDTVSAKCYIVGVDYTEYEKFRMKNKLTGKEKKMYSDLCGQSDLWTETDSTYVYNDYNNITAGKTDHHYDFFFVHIYKNSRDLVVEYGDN